MVTQRIFFFFFFNAGQFNVGYFTFWAVIAVAWGSVGSAVIIALPLIESWATIRSVLLGMFTNDRLMEKVEELNIKLHSIILAMPEAEKIYLLEKEKSKKKEALEHQDDQAVPKTRTTLSFGNIS